MSKKENQNNKDKIYHDKMNINIFVDIFFESCTNGNLEKVKACVTLGLNVNSVLTIGYAELTGLTVAIVKDNLELLEYLLSCPDGRK